MPLHPYAKLIVEAFNNKLIYVPFNYKRGGQWLLALENSSVQLYTELNVDSVNFTIYDFFLNPENGIAVELDPSEIEKIRKFAKNRLIATEISLERVFLIKKKELDHTSAQRAFF